MKKLYQIQIMKTATSIVVGISKFIKLVLIQKYCLIEKNILCNLKLLEVVILSISILSRLDNKITRFHISFKN